MLFESKNAAINHKLDLEHNQSHGRILARKKKLKYIKDHFLYTGSGLNKGIEMYYYVIVKFVICSFLCI